MGGTLAPGADAARPRAGRRRWWLLGASVALLISVPGVTVAHRLLAGTSDDEPVASGAPPAGSTVPSTTAPTTVPPSAPPTTAPATPPAPPAPPFPGTRQVALDLRPGLRGRTVFVAGDSLTVQAWAHGPGASAPTDLEVHAWLGWSAANVQPALETSVAATPIGTLVVALGTNDSSVLNGADGWTPDDAARFRRLLSTPEASACVVLVLPGHGPSVDPVYAAEMDEARAALRALAWERGSTSGTGPTVVVDWQAAVDREPTLLAGDGIHLADDPVTHTPRPASSTARTSLYWQGLRQCDGA